LKNKKVFEDIYFARKFAQQVNGEIKEQMLPGYNSVEFVYIVEW
jgi:hypothetical protein